MLQAILLPLLCADCQNTDVWASTEGTATATSYDDLHCLWKADRSHTATRAPLKASPSAARILMQGKIPPLLLLLLLTCIF
jgi:hypothetical protein